ALRTARLPLPAEERVESRARPGLGGLGPAVAGPPDGGDLAQREELAEVRLLLVQNVVRLRLAALVAGGGIEEPAVEAALQVGVTEGAAVRALKLGQQADLAPAVMAGDHGAGA